MLTRTRIWLPDSPGVLGAVATAIGTAGGNVVGLEVLERAAGVAIDELVIELPDEPGAADALCRAVRTVPGAGVELVTELSGRGPDREDIVLAAAASILQAATPTATVRALTGHLVALFELSWLALVDDDLTAYALVHGDVPPLPWVSAFATGSRSGADPAKDTTGSGVFIEQVADMGYTVCGGRPAPIRSRERHEIALLVTVAARFVDALAGQRSGGPGRAEPAEKVPGVRPGPSI